MKDKFSKIVKNATTLKDTVAGAGKEAVSKASGAKKFVETGVKTGKAAFDKATAALDKKKIADGLESAAKGVDLAAKGAKAASKGIDFVADKAGKASENLKKMSTKIKG